MVVILEISSWAGISIGAIHYYGKLKYDDPSKEEAKDGRIFGSGLTFIELERELTAVEVKAENAQLQSNGRPPHFRVGDTTTGFITRDDVRKAALKYFNENFDTNCSVLYEGEYASLSAWQNLLVWPKQYDHIAKAMNKMSKKFQSLNGYECKKDKYKYVEELDDKWRDLYNKLNKLCQPTT